jgi:uncharacterized protein YbbC (DUF1343 family)
MRLSRGAVLLCLLALAACGAGRLPPREGRRGAVVPPPAPRAVAREASRIAADPEVAPGEPDPFAAVDALVEAALAERKMPGCVVLVGRGDEVLLERAYGARALLPEPVPMTTDTVFDLASLTKPIATATSVMLLAERGTIDLRAPAARYVPELAKLPPFTVEHLMLHTSGLPAATPLADYADRGTLFQRLGTLRLKARPGERFQYSDVGFLVLEEIVRRVSKRDFAALAEEEIFRPLGMAETRFLPDAALRARAAPTEERDGVFMQGEVHDPRAWALGGVAGNAGLFSTGRDLARFAQAMLGRGALGSERLLTERTFDNLVRPRKTPGGLRALGWDVKSRYSTQRSELFSPRAFGHGGFTGTAMWVDPERDLFVVFLSNRVHPDGGGAVNPLVSEIATESARALEVRPGIDVLRADGFSRLRGARVGLITNGAARARDGTTTLDALRAADDVSLRVIFTPEHGLTATREGAISDAAYHGVPVVSLYGERFAPDLSALEGLDALVFDLQDVGVRFYTYAATMKRAMKVAAERKIRFVVLDRPNPIGGVDVEGPVLSAARSFVNHHPLPIRHGMTMGELARLFAADDALDVSLDVVRVEGWRRKDTFDRTRLAWVSPSPNLRSLEAVSLYPALGLLEATNLSVGRGTDAPFERIGAPWIEPAKLAAAIAELGVPGVAVEPVVFTPKSAAYAKQRCKGVRVVVVDRAAYEPIRTGLTIALALRKVHPESWELEKVDKLLQSPAAMQALREGKGPEAIRQTWQADLQSFREKRAAFLLY